MPGTKVWIDADYFCYAYGSLEEKGQPMKWPFIKSKLDSKIQEIIEATGADEHVLCLSGPNNFRDNIWTIQRYKGNRVDLEKPHHYQRVKDYLSSDLNWRIDISDGYEADDTVTIAMYTDPEHNIGAHVDKDLDMCPGQHYNYQHGLSYLVSPEEGTSWFYTQLLTGDPVDNIAGLRKCGPVAAKGILDGLSSNEDMFNAVKEEYIKYFGTYWETFLVENARLLWMLRTPEDIWQIPQDK